MKLLLTTIAAVVLVGCGESPKEISIHDAAVAGDIEAVKQHLAAGTDVNVMDEDGFLCIMRLSKVTRNSPNC